MKGLRYSLPLYSIAYPFITLLMFWASATIFSAIRFTQCKAWQTIPTPPRNTSKILGTFGEYLYLETDGGTLYCLNDTKWQPCPMPPYGFSHQDAPIWLFENFKTPFETESLQQLSRSSKFDQSTYYAFLSTGQIQECKTDLNTEVIILFRSGLFILLLPFIGIGIWSIIRFFILFAKEAQPGFRDFWGRFHPIK
jgi:hypothetical protein